MIKEFKTDFSYKNNRQYVHSSTLLENIKDLVLKYFQSEMDLNFPKIDAFFHKKIISNGSFFISNETKVMEREKATSATFKIYDKNSTISAIFNETKNGKVNKNIKTNYFVENLLLKESFDGSCIIDCSNPSSLFENIIEANKRIHLLTLKNKGEDLKVINLYMKNCPFLLSAVKMEKKMELQITNIAARYREGSVVTLNSLSFPEIDSEPFEISYIVNGIQGRV